jgi:hypothetical protein
MRARTADAPPPGWSPPAACQKTNPDRPRISCNPPASNHILAFTYFKAVINTLL